MPATQKNRFLAIKTALGADTLLIKNFSLTERIGRLFQIQVELRSDKPDIDFNALVGTKATIRLTTPSGGTRFFNGHISRLVQSGGEGNLVGYRAEVVPWLWFLTRAADCRIFQNKKAPDIIEEVFKAHGFSDYKLKLSGTYRQWEYCVQYRETDFNFVSRLMEQEGIFYYFEHADGLHTLILADSSSAHEPFPDYATLTYKPRTQAREEHAESVTDWTIEREVQTGVWALADFNFKTPASPIVVNANVSQSHEHAAMEIYDYPGEYTDRAEGEVYAKLRIQEIQSQHETLRGQSTVRGISAGYKFTLKGHFRDDQNRAYVTVATTLQISTGEFDSSTGISGEFFGCSFTCIPLAVPFRSARSTPKPLIQGPQTAIVVGKAGEEIDPDEFGRVKVQFHWDRVGKKDENSSCWVRVSQAWAGKTWGAMYIPRIGHEVIIEFLEGDPDRPIITGRVYNAANKVPYALPAQKNISTLKSDSTKGGGGFNEMKFDDTKGKELVYVQAEKDRQVLVKNDNTEKIGHDEKITVDHDQTTSVGNDRTESVGHDEKITIGNDRTESVGKNEKISIGANRNTDIGKNEDVAVGENRTESVSKNETITIGGNRTESVGKDEKLEVTENRTEKIGKDDKHQIGKKFALVAGDEILLQTGDASITMKKDGTIQIKGKDITVIGSGKIAVKATGDLTLKGSKIAQN